MTASPFQDSETSTVPYRLTCGFWVQGVLDGKYDDLPEQSFYMVGGIEEVIAKAEKIAKESAS